MSETDMKIDPARASALVSQLKSVSDRVAAAAKGQNVRLVAVSKLKPANDILALQQQASHLHFGENYSQELSQKAELLPRSIQWHFIGGLQSGHCKNLAKIPNLFCVSSVDTQKKAQLLDEHRGKLLASSSSTPKDGGSSSQSSPPVEHAPGKLNIHVQVNTSGEDSKSGCQPGDETVSLCKFIDSDETCPNLNLLGLMTIGAIARSVATTPENENEDFVLLKEQRDLVAKVLGRADGAENELELSMGMSEDFEGAIALGSGEVRVGSTIFGERGPKSEAKILA
ncbi:PLP dependent protein [Microdochium nivale]|nr:PLP dependent protein [Microdochium nivale]